MLGWALLALCAAPAQAAGTAIPAVGTTWKYDFRDQLYGGGRSFSIEVTAVDGAKVKERLYVDGGDITEDVVDASQIRFHAHPLTGESVFLDFAPYSAEVAKRIARSPAGYPTGPIPNWKISAPTYADERVTVPAGIFATVRVQVTGRSGPVGSLNNTTAMAPTRFVYTCWHSAELGRCVKIRHQTWNHVSQQIGDDLVQLVGYEQPGRPGAVR